MINICPPFSKHHLILHIQKMKRQRTNEEDKQPSFTNNPTITLVNHESQSQQYLIMKNQLEEIKKVYKSDELEWKIQVSSLEQNKHKFTEQEIKNAEQENKILQNNVEFQNMSLFNLEKEFNKEFQIVSTALPIVNDKTEFIRKCEKMLSDAYKEKSFLYYNLFEKTLSLCTLLKHESKEEKGEEVEKEEKIKLQKEMIAILDSKPKWLDRWRPQIKSLFD